MTPSVLAYLCAAIEPLRPGSPTLSRTTRQVLTGTAPVIAIALLVLVAFVIWAAFIRKSDAARRRGRILPGTATSPDSPAAASSGGRRRRRRRREKSRPRNPTLAETGGLPPLRDSSEPPQGL